MRGAARTLAGITLAFGASSLVRHSSRFTSPLVPLKQIGGALAPYTVVGGVLAAVLGVASRSPFTAAAGLAGSLLQLDGILRILAVEGGVAAAFGTERPRTMASRPTLVAARRSRRCLARQRPRWSRDVAFYTPADTSSPILADLWEPPHGTDPSGVAVIYLHGSSWYLLDKDVLTRPMFRRLALAGHVVMDVAYRQCPEVDVVGMVGDAKRAVAWLKDHASRFRVDPDRVVVMGASSGGQIALLTAFAADARLTPDDVEERDLTVAGAISFYGVSDLREYGMHTEARLADRRETGDRRVRMDPGPLARWAIAKLLGRPLAARQLPPTPCFRQMMADMVGGMPDEVPGRYDLVSPIHHASPTAPPTLLVHGAHDSSVPVASSRRLYQSLVNLGVPVAYDEFPRTEHAFDLVYPPFVAPAARLAVREVERFLAHLGRPLIEARQGLREG